MLSSAIADFIIKKGLPYSLSNDPLLERVIKAARTAPQNFKPPQTSRNWWALPRRFLSTLREEECPHNRGRGQEVPGCCIGRKRNALLAFLFLVSIFNRKKFQFLEFQTQELGRGKFFSCQQCQRVSNQQEHAGTGSHQNPAAAHKGLWWDSATRPLTRTRNSGFWSERPEFP